MTTSTAPRPALRAHHVLGLLTAAGTLPYLAIKADWLAGGTLGVRDVAMLADPSMVVLNAVTVGMDLLVIALAFALIHPVGRRIPAVAVLLPIWVGTGLLIPMAVAIMPAAVLGELTSDSDVLESWVRPMVYGGFAWQGIGLSLTFAGYAARRWGPVVAAPAPIAAPLRSVLRVLTGGGAAAVAVSGALYLVSGFAAGSGTGALMSVASAAFAAAGAVGVARLVRGTADHRWATVVAAWIGTGTTFAWALWSTTLTMAGTVMGGADPIGGPAALTGLLGGFALAAAGLVALAGSADRTG